jgi:hypothetical protein
MWPGAINFKSQFRILFKIIYLYRISKLETIKPYTPADMNGLKEAAFNMLEVNLSNNRQRQYMTNKIDYRTINRILETLNYSNNVASYNQLKL